jgi:Protein of unknown function (DUF1353)
MTKYSISPMRRKILVETSRVLLLGGVAGCASLPRGTPQEVEQKEFRKERHAFISNAMNEMNARIARENLESRSRGVEAAMRVSTLTPFGDWDYYYLKGGTILWRPNQGQSFRPVEVPDGFVSDLTSVPRLFWQILRPEGRYAYAAVVHDYLYWTQTRSKDEADLIFKTAMEDSNVDEKTSFAVYQAVNQLGQSAWDKNRQLKNSGERRVLKRFPDDFKVSWAEWKKNADVFM